MLMAVLCVGFSKLHAVSRRRRQKGWQTPFGLVDEESRTEVEQISCFQTASSLRPEQHTHVLYTHTHPAPSAMLYVGALFD